MSLYIKSNDTPINAEVEINEEGLCIVQANGIRVQWDKSKIHKAIGNTNKNYIIHYGDEPFETFETNDKSIIISLQKKHAGYGFHIPKSNSVFKAEFVFVSIIVVFVLFVIGFYTVGLDWISKSVASAIPVSTEESIGQSLYESTVPSDKIDRIKSQKLDSFFKLLGYPSDYHIKLTVVDSGMVNAFALPGGHLVVMTGILQQMHSYEELAALLGHELSHINGKHVTRSLVRTAGAYILISAVIGDVTGVAAAVVENADGFRSLQFSRDLETEADERGLELMKKRNINPMGMVDLFERLKEAEKGEAPSEFLSTHPPTDARIQNIYDKINNAPIYKSDKMPVEQALQKLFKELKGSQ